MPKPKAAHCDVRVSNEGSLFLFALLTPAARSWVDENVSEDRTYFAGSLVVEPRYAQDLADGMLSAGLCVE